MALTWLNIEEKTLEGIELGNAIEDETFEKLIHYIYQNIEPNHTLTLLCSADAKMADFESPTNLNRHQLGFVVRTFSHILRSALKVILKPSDLKADLTDKLKMTEQKSLLLLQLWIQATKHILDDMKSGEGGQLKDVTWNLAVEVSSDVAQKEKAALGQLKLQTKDGDQINCFFNHSELSDFYNQLENIQAVLDDLKK